MSSTDQRPPASSRNPLPAPDERAPVPVPRDDFEVAVRNRRLWVGMALVVGICGSLPALAILGTTRRPEWIAGSILAFCIPAAWIAIVAAFARWLGSMHSVPGQLRQMIVFLVLMGVPIALIALAQGVGLGK